MQRARWRRWALGLLAFAILYLVMAYVVLPALWKHYEHHRSLEGAPTTTVDASGIPGDPLNVAFVATQPELLRALARARWVPADSITLETSIAIVESVFLRRPDPAAPVSPLYLWGRRQDLAFEKDMDGSAKRRHHVRLWRADELGKDGRPLWIGAASFDSAIGVSHLTGQFTHHTSADIDAERDTLLTNLDDARQLTRIYAVTGVGPTVQGRNANGDRYYTDGEMYIGTVIGNDTLRAAPAERLPSPLPVRVKDAGWHWIARRMH